VLLSDTHNYAHKIKLPYGDILMHTGDFTIHGTVQEIVDFNDWLGEHSYFKHIIVVAGNHDKDPEVIRTYLTNATFLANETVEVMGIKIHGTTWKFEASSIPTCDILLTHVPPKGYGDIIHSGESRGSSKLTKAIFKLNPPPKVHMFGHNHEGYMSDIHKSTVFINGAVCHGGPSSTIRRKAIYFEFYPQEQYKEYYEEKTAIEFTKVEIKKQDVKDEIKKNLKKKKLMMSFD